MKHMCLLTVVIAVSESGRGKGVSRGWLQSHFLRFCRALLAVELHLKDNLSTAEHSGKERPCVEESLHIRVCVQYRMHHMSNNTCTKTAEAAKSLVHTHTHIKYIYIYSSIVLKSITCNVTVAQMRAPCNHHRAAISGRLSGRISKVVICSQAHFQSDAGLAARPPDLERGPHHLQTSALFGIFSNGTI